MSDTNPNQHKSSHPPFKVLGKYLKTMRQKFQESLGETSGAVEIQVEQLDRFERGVEAPSEDILLLLISHFNVQDDEAVELWELAGYERSSRLNGEADRTDTQQRQPVPVMLLAVDNRILYSNGVEIDADENGMVLQFLQNADSEQEKATVSRIGISHDQAERLIHQLQTEVLRKRYLSGPRQLPPPAQ